MTGLCVMRPSVTAESATSRVARLLGEETSIERRVLYPWYHIAISGRLRWLFGHRRIDFRCLVDARTGRAASTDELALDHVMPAAGEALDVLQDAGTARRAASRFASHVLGRRFRMLGHFDLRAGDVRVVHRPYWIVRAGPERLLLDAVTGELHPLSAARTM